MKLIYITILLFSMSSKAAFISESTVGKCSGILKSFTSKERCESLEGEKCYKTPKKNRCEHHVLADELIDDISKPILSKHDSISCLDISDCDSKFLSLSCSDASYEKIKNYDLLEVYCVEVTGYEKKLSGRKIIKSDSAKKAQYDAKISKKSQRRLRVLIGKQKRAKCKEALDYISGGNAGLSEAEVDAMETAFSSIHSALSKNRIDKAIRLIGLVSDPSFEDLKIELLEILN